MNTLLLEIISWLGYLERPEVILQLVVSLGLITLCRLGRDYRWIKRLPSWAYSPLALSLLALASLVSHLLGLPHGLSSMVGLFWLGWLGLNLLNRLLHRWLPEQRVQQLDSRLLRPVYLLTTALILISSLESLQELAVLPLGTVMGIPLYLGRLLTAVVMGYLVLVASGPPAAGVAWLAQRALHISPGSRKAMELMLQYLVVGLGLLAMAFHLGLNSTALIAVAGGLSVGLGFGIKEVFSNFVSGLWLLFEGSVRPGEVLMIDGDPCEVRRLGPRATLLWRDRDNAELLIPNQSFFTDRTTTYTATDRMRRSQVNVGAAYHHDPTAVMALLEATALQVPRVLPEPHPKALMLNYGDFAINYALRFWIAQPMDNASICSEVNQAIWHAFQQHGIEIPFPQQVNYELLGPPQGPSQPDAKRLR